MLRLSSLFVTLVLALTAAFASGAAAANTSTAQAAAMTHVVVSYPDGGGPLPLYYAQDMGIFAKHGLAVEFQPLGGGPPASPLLCRGRRRLPTPPQGRWRALLLEALIHCA